MHSVLVDLLPTGTIDHALEAFLTDPNDSDLVVVRGPILEVYKYAQAPKPHIVMHSRHFLAAHILDIKTLKGEAEGYEQLVLAFPGSRYSIVEYNNTVRDFVTVSLHSFIDDAQKDHLLAKAHTGSLVATEEAARCIVFRVGDSQLAFLPKSKVGEERWRRSVVIPFTVMDERIRNVLQVSFLPGYLETTMAILYEPQKTWPYRLPVSKDTVCLLILTVDFTKEMPTFTKIAAYDSLPSDTRQMWTPSEKGHKIRGILLAGANELLFIDPGHPSVVALGVNSFAAITSQLSALKRLPLPTQQTTMAEALFLEAGGRILVFSDDGRPFSCNITRDGGSKRIELTPWPATFPEMRDKTIHLTVKFGHGNALIVPTVGDAVVYKDLEGVSSKKQSNGSTLREDLEDDLYREGPDQVASSASLVSAADDGLSVIGTIPCHGPLSDFCIGGSPGKLDMEVAMTSGSGKCGTITMFRQNIPYKIQSQFQISNCRAVFPLPNEVYLVATANSTMVFSKSDSGIKQIKTLATIDDQETVFAKSFRDGIVQVTRTGLRVTTGDLEMVIAEVTFSFVGTITRVQCEQSFLAVGLEDGSLYIFHMASSGQVEPLDLAIRAFSAWDVKDSGGNVLLFGISAEFGLTIQDLTSPKPIFSNPHIHQLPMAINHVPVDQSNPASPSLIEDMSVLHDPQQSPLVILSGRSFGLVMYMGDAELKSLVRIPRAQYAGSLANGAIPDGGALIKLQRVSVGVERKEMVLAHSKSRHWLVHLGDLCYPRMHPIRLSAKTVSISSEGFGLYKSDGTFCFIIPDSRFCLDYDWPFSRCFLEGEAARAIVYHAPSATYSLITARMTDFALPTDDHAPISDNEMVIPEDALKPQQYVHKLKLLSPRTGTLIDEYSMKDDDEYALCMASATLETKQTTSGRQAFIAVGTSMNRGEDRPARGRVLILDVVEIVPEVDRPEADRRYKLLADEEMKGPVTALCHLNGYLAVSLASKVIIHSFENNESLTGVAFVDFGVYAASIASVKGYLAVGDLCKSLSFNIFQEKPPKVITLGRDFEDRAIAAVEFLVNGNTGQMYIVAGDFMENLHLFDYNPTSEASEGGTKLVHRGTLSLPLGRVQKMRRIVLGEGQMHGTLIGGAGGSLSLLCPVEETVFRRSFSLGLRLASILPHPAGIHPRAARQASPILNRPLPMARTLIDATPTGLLRLFDLPRAAVEHLSLMVNQDDVAAVMEIVNAVLKPTCFYS